MPHQTRNSGKSQPKPDFTTRSAFQLLTYRSAPLLFHTLSFCECALSWGIFSTAETYVINRVIRCFPSNAV